MTTYELMREGEWTRDGRLVTPDTITWYSDMIPVLGHDKQNLGSIVGAVTNIRREGNKIVGDTDVEIPEGYLLTTDCDNYKTAREIEPGRVEMTGLRIRMTHISKKEQYPWDVDI